MARLSGFPAMSNILIHAGFENYQNGQSRFFSE